MLLDIAQVREFITLLTGDANTSVTWQVFYDPKNEEKRPELANHFVGRLDDNIDYLNHVQSLKCGVYVGINESDGHGRGNANIVKFRALFADFDGMAEPVWALTPHFIQKRDDTHGHAFWLVSDVATGEEYQALQKRIALYHGTDNAVTDPARVVRASGTVHYKNPLAPAMYSITDDNTDGDHKYTKAEIEAAFPLNAVQDAALNQWLSTRAGLQDGSGYEENERYNEQFRNWLKIAPVAIKGEGRSYTMIKVASYAHDHGIPVETCKQIMWEHYNPRVIPPYDESEKRYKHDVYVERAYKYAHSAAGCKTAIGSFKNAEAIPEPEGGWDAHIKAFTPPDETLPMDLNAATKAMRESNRLDKQTAASIHAQLQGAKSAHYDLALVIDGMLWNGLYLIRNDKTFYEFNGKVWVEISDETVKARIQKFYAAYKPSDTLVRGILASLCDLVNVSKVQTGKWLNDNSRDPSNIAIFKNGMVDLSKENPTLEPHDRNFFTFTMLNYDYDTNAKCPEFIKFLRSIWDGDDKLIMQLQEFMGYLLVSDISLQKFAVFIGKSRGGKGVLTDMIRLLVGEDNVCAPSLSDLTKDHVKHTMSKCALALIPDAHSVAFNNRDTTASALKAFTGGDATTYDVKYKPSVTTVLLTKFILSTNNMPEFDDPSGALANRMLVYPFTKSFAGRENTNLRSQLREEIAGIAQWAREGLTRLRANGGRFTESQASLIEKEEIREDMFPLAQYVNSACNIREDVTCSTEQLYMAYRLWCTSKGIKTPFTEIKFSKTLRNSDLNVHPCKVVCGQETKRGYRGIRVNPEIIETLSIGRSNVTPIRKAE